MANKMPQWVQNLMIDALVYWESKGNQVSIPVVQVRHRSRFYSSGTTYTKINKIVLTLGKDRTDARLIVLHELAHTLATAMEHHSDLFWSIAWDLYKWAKLPMRYALSRESNYMKGSKRVYKAIKKQEGK